MLYFRPIPQVGPSRPAQAISLAGGWSWATHAEELSRSRAPRVVPVAAVPGAWRAAWAAPRPAMAGLRWDIPQLMGIVNATPDSFSDGGRSAAQNLAHSRALSDCCDILDIGGESTRPGAVETPVDEEIARTAPLIAKIRAAGIMAPISIDTRKAAVAEAALNAGAQLVNDVSGFTFDPALAPLCAARDVPVCVMHSQGLPEVMQHDPRYDDILLDVFDFLAGRIDALRAVGVQHIIADPGIGFGKTRSHNLALLARISLFHGLGVPILLGASRKRFIGGIADAPEAADRDPGSIAVALAALAQGIQLIRAHDAAGHTQAIALWRASVAHTSP